MVWFGRSLNSGFPRNNNNNNNKNYSYAVSAILMEIPPGAYYYEQEWHVDGYPDDMIPLTNHRAQGTTVFHGGVYSRFALVFIIIGDTTNPRLWRGTLKPVVIIIITSSSM